MNNARRVEEFLCEAEELLEDAKERLRLGRTVSRLCQRMGASQKRLSIGQWLLERALADLIDARRDYLNGIVFGGRCASEPRRIVERRFAVGEEVPMNE